MNPLFSTRLYNRAADFFGLGVELIVLMFLARLILDIGNRIFIPFLPRFSDGLGLSITAFGWVLALRALTGLASPIVGVLADRYGRRRIMVIAL